MLKNPCTLCGAGTIAWGQTEEKNRKDIPMPTLQEKRKAVLEEQKRQEKEWQEKKTPKTL